MFSPENAAPWGPVTATLGCLVGITGTTQDVAMSPKPLSQREAPKTLENDLSLPIIQSVAVECLPEPLSGCALLFPLRNGVHLQPFSPTSALTSPLHLCCLWTLAFLSSLVHCRFCHAKAYKDTYKTKPRCSFSAKRLMNTGLYQGLL